MEINVNIYSKEHSFLIKGASYIGNPISNTAMFVSKKIERLLCSLNEVKECLIFAENGIDVPVTLAKKHCFILTDKPQYEYALFSCKFHEEEERVNNSIPYDNVNGSYISKSAQIDSSSIIEPFSLVGPGVVIGKNCRILSGTVIKNAWIGNNVYINEKAIIGSNGFTMAEDCDGNKIRIYSLGKVIIGNNVEIGSHDNISRGSGGDTIIEDNVKIDTLVHIGHDVRLQSNTEITAGAIVGGFVNTGNKSYIGINAVLRNRISIGNNSFVGMGATVTKSVDPNTIVVGNPAKPFIKQ